MEPPRELLRRVRRPRGGESAGESGGEEACALGEESVWLPRVATSELLVPDRDLAHVVPTVARALAVGATAIWSLRREWATRGRWTPKAWGNRPRSREKTP